MPALDAGPRPRLGDRGVRDAPRLDGRPQAARRHQGPARTAARVEIQRLIGRSLRGVVDFDGARRAHGLRRLRRPAGRRRHPLRVDHRRLRRARARAAAARRRRASSTAVPLTGIGRRGLVRRRRRRAAARPRLPRGLARAEVDANVVMTGDGGLVEVQATAERTPLSRAHLDELLALAEIGIEELRAAQAGRARSAVILATRNAHKLREFERLLGGRRASSRCPTARPTPEETGATFAENALIKARAAAAATGRAAIADDSGIGAEALDWAPGRALRPLRRRRTPPTRRTSPSSIARSRRARRCGTRASSPTSPPTATETLFEGTCDGVMADAAARATGGFGYDPVFARRPTAARWPSSPTTRRTRSPTAASPPEPARPGSLTDRAARLRAQRRLIGGAIEADGARARRRSRSTARRAARARRSTQTPTVISQAMRSRVHARIVPDPDDGCTPARRSRWPTCASCRPTCAPSSCSPRRGVLAGGRLRPRRALVLVAGAGRGDAAHGAARGRRTATRPSSRRAGRAAASARRRSTSPPRWRSGAPGRAVDDRFGPR